MREKVIHLVESIAKAIVSYPDDVRIEWEEATHNDLPFLEIYISAHDDDVGALIGKKGCVADALRTILSRVSFISRASGYDRHIFLRVNSPQYAKREKD